jgi:cell division protein FtsB
VELRAAIAEVRAANLSLARRNADLERHNKELREAVDALLQPAPSELLAHNLAHPSRQALHKPEE